jgi:hypothetical protein
VREDTSVISTLAHWGVGYDTGVISGALVTIGSDLGPQNLTNGQKVHICCLFSEPISNQ